MSVHSVHQVSLANSAEIVAYSNVLAGIGICLFIIAMIFWRK